MSAKLIQENNAREQNERMPIDDLPEHSIQCATCLLVHSKTDLEADGFICRECGDMVCRVCGCTDSVACEEGCDWTEPGRCSTHDDEEE